MADMSFIDKLTPEQDAIANMVADRAIAMGVDPRLAVTLAYRESRFNPTIKGTSGEIGVMQVMPNTGKMLGFSADDLKDPSKNIDAGLKYLKQNLDRFNDPVDAVAAYNAGPDHPYFKDPTKNELPKSTMTYLGDIRDLGGFSSISKAEEPKPIPEEDQASEQGFLEDKARVIGDLLGAGLGATAAKGLEMGANIGKTGAAIRELPGLLTQSAAPGTSSGAKWLQNWGNIQKPGFSGGVPEAAAQYQKMQPQSKIMADLAKRGLITPQAVTPGELPRPQLSIKGQIPTPTPPGALSQVGGMAQRAVGALAGSPIASGALGGLSIAEQAQEFAKRKQAQDAVGMMISGAGALGGGMQVLPHPVPRAIGAGLSAASPLAMAIYDRIRSEPDPLAATEEELREAARPAFVRPMMGRRYPLP